MHTGERCAKAMCQYKCGEGRAEGDVGANEVHTSSGHQSWNLSHDGEDVDADIPSLRSEQCCQHACRL